VIPIEGIAIGKYPNPTLCGFEESPPKVGGIGGLFSIGLSRNTIPRVD